MSFTEVSKFRKEGNYSAAYELAVKDLQAEPDSIWAKRAMGWCLYDSAKAISTVANRDSFVERLQELRDLQLPETETMIFNCVCWPIGAIIADSINQKWFQNDYFDLIFSIVKDMSFDKPSKEYSYLLISFLKLKQDWSNLIYFIEWWGWDGFLPEDYEGVVMKNGKKMLSLVERTYIAYANALLDKEIDTEKVKAFLPHLEQIMDAHPEYKYPSFFKAKLLLSIGNRGESLSAFLPFAREKKNEFWVWSLLAEIFAGDASLQFSCYCKALSVKTTDDFLVKVRQSFAAVLVRDKKYDEAKTEIMKILTTRNDNSWGIPNQVLFWMNQEWYKEAHSKNSNFDLYSQNKKEAERVLYSDLPEEVAVIEYVNEMKGIINFIINKEKHGFCKYDGILKNPKIGDILIVRLSNKGDSGLYSLHSAVKVENGVESEAVKYVKGNLRITNQSNFGFLNDAFVGPEIIRKYHLSNNQRIEGKAILSMNKKKNEWGWKLIEIANISKDNHEN